MDRLFLRIASLSVRNQPRQFLLAGGWYYSRRWIAAGAAWSRWVIRRRTSSMLGNCLFSVKIQANQRSSPQSMPVSWRCCTREGKSTPEAAIAPYCWNASGQMSTSFPSHWRFSSCQEPRRRDISTAGSSQPAASISIMPVSRSCESEKRTWFHQQSFKTGWWTRIWTRNLCPSFSLFSGLES